MEVLGIDISTWQDSTKISYNELVKEIDFAILRAGFTAQADGRTLVTDNQFENHYKELSKRSVPMGVYFYSCAVTKNQARREALYVLDLIKDKTFAYPIYIDTEDSTYQGKATKQQLTNAIKAFCEVIQDEGLIPGVYASESWFNSKLDISQLTGIDFWVANWSAKPKIRHDMWQHSDKGRLTGYTGNLDLNKDFKNYAKKSEIKPPPVDLSDKRMTSKILVETALKIVKTPTVYMWGTYGRRLTRDLIDYKATQYPRYNTPTRVAIYNQLLRQGGYDAWDCVGLLKGILWGWDGSGHVPYAANGVPDIGSDTMIQRCEGVSTDFTKIIPGEVVWMVGHIGLYIGDGLVIEATPSWKDGVQITALANVGSKAGYNSRRWTTHGRLPWVNYGIMPEPKPTPVPTTDTHKVVQGDTPWGLAQIYLGDGTRYPEIMALNGLDMNAHIVVGQILKIPTDYVTHRVVKGDNPWDLAVKYLGNGARYTEIMQINNLAIGDHIYEGQLLIMPKR